MGCSTYLGLGWRYQPLAPGHPTSICDIGVNVKKFSFHLFVNKTNFHMKSFALSLALMMRFKEIQKWPIH